uniref:Late embryogenesis abundant protein LEA-2 subgroup domain-containing protein n=1 Tax=Fagus sylvatica TaxID=28930 RepID=A0A2N9J1Y7_FAGSY
MLALPPPPPPPTLPPPPPQKQTKPVSLDQIVISKQAETLPPPPPQKQTKPVSLDQIVISKQAENQQNRAPNTPKSDIRISRKASTLLAPRPRQTNPITWCIAFLCLIFCLILIFFGVATLITFIVIKPRYPLFDIPNANLNSIYFDSPEYFNGDLTFLANFSNPNRKIDVRFEYLDIELFFSDRLIATQTIEPFTQRRGEKRLESVHFISSLVFLPQNLAVELQKQVQSSKVSYNVRGTYKVTATLGLIHISYWLHSRCQLEMTGPPTGVLVARSCRTKR